jgi:RNA recognition motif-containing protein
MELPSVWSHLSLPALEDQEGESQTGRSRLTFALQDAGALPVRQRQVKMSKLFFVNIPYNCSDRELQEWVESRGIETRSIRIVRDLVAGVSPAFGYVELKDDSRIQEAISILNGKRMRNQTILVKEAQVQTTGATRGSGMERRTA